MSHFGPSPCFYYKHCHDEHCHDAIEVSVREMKTVVHSESPKFEKAAEDIRLHAGQMSHEVIESHCEMLDIDEKGVLLFYCRYRVGIAKDLEQIFRSMMTAVFHYLWKFDTHEGMISSLHCCFKVSGRSSVP
jgi:hypothetical protein